MENKKNFFELLDQKTAIWVAILAGIGILSTLVCLFFSIMAFQGRVNFTSKPIKSTVLNSTVNSQVLEVVKADKPIVELFVMSYCSYGLQMQKAFLPVMELLKDKADLSIKFVSYAMHDKLEIDENNTQHCLQEEQSDKLISYLKCFTTKGDSKICLKETGVNESNLNSCISAVDKKFGITLAYNDKNSWLSGRFPIYPVDEGLNEKYGVQGSPTLVINGSQVQVSRSPEAVKLAICASFNQQPNECGQTLSTAAASPSFGSGVDSSATAAGCGN